MSSRRDQEIEVERQESSEEAGQEIGIFDGIKTMGNGLLKGLKGIADVFVGPFMGASGLEYADVDEILNAPLFDWLRLWGERREAVNKGRTGWQQILKGVPGFFKGLVNGLKNGGKDLFVGLVPMLFGGIYIVKKLKDDFGLKPEIIRAALKTGHPIGLMVGIAGESIDKAAAFCEKLEPQLKKYESLGQLGKNAIEAIQRKNIRQAVKHDFDLAERVASPDFKGIRENAHQVAALGQSIYQQVGRGNLERAVQKAVIGVVKNIGVDPQHLSFEHGKILLEKVPVGQKLKAIYAILDSNPQFGLNARAQSYDDALRKLIARGDLRIVERLTAVILPQAARLSGGDLARLKQQAIEAIKARTSESFRPPVTAAYTHQWDKGGPARKSPPASTIRGPRRQKLRSDPAPLRPRSQ